MSFIWSYYYLNDLIGSSGDNYSIRLWLSARGTKECDPDASVSEISQLLLV